MYKPEDYFKDLTQEVKQPFKYGTITQLNSGSTPYVRLDGETNAAEIGIPYIDSYTPVVNDRVLMVNYNGLVIIGKIIT